MKSDIVFIHPGNHLKTYQDLANEYTAIATPVWTCLLADYIRREGYNVAIYDSNIEGWSAEKASKLLSQYHPELIVIMVYGHNPSASTQTMPAASHIVSELKSINNDIPIAMGGLHPTALPDKTLKEEQIDFVIKGEGIHPVKHLIEYLTGKRNLNSVQGICYRAKDGTCIHSELAKIEKNLDNSYQGYAWDLLPPLTLYRAHNSHTLQYFEESKRCDFSDVRSPYAILYTSLGCPFKCSFCCINALFGDSRIRYWSLDKVIEWIDVLVSKHHVKHIRIDDELFVLSPKRVELFCDMLIERKYDINLWAYARVDTIKDHLLKKMKMAGINWICLGIESASKDVREGVNKHITKNISDIVRRIQYNGIYVLGNYMFGLPHDTLETMRATLDLAIELNCEFANFYSTMAYPGSNLYGHWIKESPDIIPNSWNGFSQHSYDSKPLPTKYLSPREVLKFRDKAFHTYFTNEKYLTSVKQKFGQKALDHIQRMTTIRLKRRLLKVNKGDYLWMNIESSS